MSRLIPVSSLVSQYAGSLDSPFCLCVEFYTFHRILPVPHLVFLVVVFGLGLSVSKLYSYFLSCFFCLLPRFHLLSPLCQVHVSLSLSQCLCFLFYFDSLCLLCVQFCFPFFTTPDLSLLLPQLSLLP